MTRRLTRFLFLLVFPLALLVQVAEADAVEVLADIRKAGIRGLADFRGDLGSSSQYAATGVPPGIGRRRDAGDVVATPLAVTLPASDVVETPEALETDDILDEILATADIPQLAVVPYSQDNLTAVSIQNDLNNDTAMTPVPEPATAVLLATGLIVGTLRKRQLLARKQSNQ